jgi:hypothetical protein
LDFKKFANTGHLRYNGGVRNAHHPRRKELATTVYTVEEVELQDGTVASLRPLVIKRLRHFMKMIGEMGEMDDQEAIEDVMMNCAAFCIAREHPQYWDEKKKNGTYDDPEFEKTGKPDEEIPQIERLRGGYTEEFEDAIDTQTMVRIIKVCGGIDFENPELLRAAQQAALAAEAGTTD